MTIQKLQKSVKSVASCLTLWEINRIMSEIEFTLFIDCKTVKDIKSVKFIGRFNDVVITYKEVI